MERKRRFDGFERAAHSMSAADTGLFGTVPAASKLRMLLENAEMVPFRDRGARRTNVAQWDNPSATAPFAGAYATAPDKRPRLFHFADDVDGMDDARNIAEERQQDIQQQRLADADLQK